MEIGEAPRGGGGYVAESTVRKWLTLHPRYKTCGKSQSDGDNGHAASCCERIGLLLVHASHQTIEHSL